MGDGKLPLLDTREQRPGREAELEKSLMSQVTQLHECTTSGKKRASGPKRIFLEYFFSF